MNLQLLYTAFQGLAALFILYTVIPGSQLQKYDPFTPKATPPPHYTPSATHDIDDSFLKRTDIWLDFDTVGKLSGIHKLGIVPATPSSITPSRTRISALSMNDLRKASPQPFTRNFRGKNSSVISNSGIIIILTSIIGIFLGVFTLFVGKPVSGSPDKEALISSNTTDNQEILNVPTRGVASLSPVVDTIESQRPSPFGTPPIISGVSHVLSPFSSPSPLTTTPCAKYDAKLAIITVSKCDLIKPISPLNAKGPVIEGPITSLLPSVEIDSSVSQFIRRDNNQSPVESSCLIQKSKASPCSSSASPAIRSYTHSQGTPLSFLENLSTELTPETRSIQSMHAWYDQFDAKLDLIQVRLQASTKIHDDFETQLECGELKKEKDMARLDSLLESFMEDDEDFTQPSSVASDDEIKEHLLAPQRSRTPSASEDGGPCPSSFPTLLVFDSSEFLATISVTNLNSLAADGPSDLTDSQALLPEYTPQGTPEIWRLLSHDVTRLLDVKFEYALGEAGQEDEGEIFPEPMAKTLWPKNLAPTNPLSPQPNSPPQTQAIDLEPEDEVDWSQDEGEEGDDDVLNLEELDRVLLGLDPLSDSDEEIFDESLVSTLWPENLALSNPLSFRLNSPPRTQTVNSAELDGEMDWSQDDEDDEDDDISSLVELDRLLPGFDPLSDSDSDSGEIFVEQMVETLCPKNLAPTNPLYRQPNSSPQTRTIIAELEDEVDWSQDEEEGDDDDILNLEELDRLSPGLDPLSDSDEEIFDETIVSTQWPKNPAPSNPLSLRPHFSPQTRNINSELGGEADWSQDDDEEVDDDSDDILNLVDLDRLLPGLDPLSDSDDEY